MAISKQETKQLLQRLIFAETSPRDWVQDIWDLNPLLGEDAAKLLDVFEALMECCPQERLENLLQDYYEEGVT